MSYDPREVRGTPHVAPLLPQFPLRMRNTEILTVVYRSDRAAIEAMVPEPLVLLGDLVLVHVYAMHDAEWFGVYGESAVHIPVRHETSGTTGAYSPFLVVEGDGPVAAGREIYGQPKKAGQIALAAHGDLLVGTVTRNDITIVTATMPYKQVAGTPEDLEKHASFRTNINLKVVPDVDGSGMAVRELTARTLADVVVHEVWRGRGTLELRPNAQVPVHLLPVREVVEAFHWRADFSLVDGEVIERFS
jgi:acetoacetate decarboxylase